MGGGEDAPIEKTKSKNKTKSTSTARTKSKYFFLLDVVHDHLEINFSELLFGSL
jgi:hypothetical protein